MDRKDKDKEVLNFLTRLRRENRSELVERVVWFCFCLKRLVGWFWWIKTRSVSSQNHFFFSHLGGFVRWRRDIFSSEERVGPAAGWLHPIARPRAASCPDGQRNLLNCPPPLPNNQVLHGGATSCRERRRRGGGATARTRRGGGGRGGGGEGGGAFHPSDVKLVGGQVVHEGLHQEVGGEVEDQAEGDGDGESRQGLLEDGQQQQGQAQALGVTGESGR